MGKNIVMWLENRGPFQYVNWITWILILKKIILTTTTSDVMRKLILHELQF